MINSFKTVKKEARFETLNQGSKFIGYVSQISSIDDAKNFVVKLKKQHPFATHVCYAFALIENGNRLIRTKSSDDKEPAGTAGKPILDILINKGFANTIVCVVRYFGGTLLGASNLLRAYANACEKVLENSQNVQKLFVEKVNLVINYNEVSKVEKFLIDNKIQTLNTEFLEDVLIEVGIELDNKTVILNNLNELLGRKVEFENLEKDFIECVK